MTYATHLHGMDLSAIASPTLGAIDVDKAVSLDATGVITYLDDGTKPLGVLETAPVPGCVVRIKYAGVAKVVAAATITQGDFLDADATGSAIVGTGVLGQAMESATTGETLSVKLT